MKLRGGGGEKGRRNEAKAIEPGPSENAQGGLTDRDGYRWMASREISRQRGVDRSEGVDSRNDIQFINNSIQREQSDSLVARRGVPFDRPVRQSVRLRLVRGINTSLISRLAGLFVRPINTLPRGPHHVSIHPPSWLHGIHGISDRRRVTGSSFPSIERFISRYNAHPQTSNVLRLRTVHSRLPRRRCRRGSFFSPRGHE